MQWVGWEGCKEGIVREFRTYMYTLLYLKWITSKAVYCIAKGTLLNVMWQHGWEGNSREKGYTFMYG